METNCLREKINLNMRKILYKLTTRSRREKAVKAIENIINFNPKGGFAILLSIDTDDETMKDFRYDSKDVIVMQGLSKNKIDAINRDMDKIDAIYDWDILVNFSDDMEITSSEFPNVLRSVYSTNLDFFLHLPDGYQNDRIPTMSIMGKTYYQRFNFIYHPSYQSVWCDNEAMEVAKMLDKWIYLPTHLFTHNHPVHLNEKFDEQYEKTESPLVHSEDFRNFEARKKLNFPN
jgi:hypothetical protein